MTEIETQAQPDQLETASRKVGGLAAAFRRDLDALDQIGTQNQQQGRAVGPQRALLTSANTLTEALAKWRKQGYTLKVLLPTEWLDLADAVHRAAQTYQSLGSYPFSLLRKLQQALGRLSDELAQVFPARSPETPPADASAKPRARTRR